MTATVPYQPYWCEENAWHLSADRQLGGGARAVVLTTNATRSVAMWNQRAMASTEHPLVWDYHVFVCVVERGTVVVWDPDSRLGMPVALAEYVTQSFRPTTAVFEPRFRVWSAASYRRAFASDRRHMKDRHGNDQQPPPPWSPIGRGHTLDRMLDLGDPWAGAHGSLSELPGMLARC